ncbi:disulfide bond formation protein B, partial [Mesorhizobium sp. M2D.F.Ca.ET.145.01.1.1]
MTATMNADTGRQRTRAALFLAVAMAATVGSALGFQHIGGYIP